MISPVYFQWRSQRAERGHAIDKPSAEGARQLGG